MWQHTCQVLVIAVRRGGSITSATSCAKGSWASAAACDTGVKGYMRLSWRNMASGLRRHRLARRGSSGGIE